MSPERIPSAEVLLASTRTLRFPRGLLELGPELLPVSRPAVRVSPRRLRRLRLQPPHPAGTRIKEAVQHPYPAKQYVAGPETGFFAFDFAFDLALEEKIRLFEGMVVHLSSAAWLVVDGEHCHQFGAQVGVDQHLDRDPAVGQQGGVHTGRPPAALRTAQCERCVLRRRPQIVAQVPQGRVGEIGDRYRTGPDDGTK